MIPRLIALSGIFILLSGCGDSQVDKVKNARSDNPDYTYGQFLDNRKHCNKTSWKSMKDDRGRIIVEYSCTHQSVNSNLLENALARHLETIEREANVILDNYLKTRANLESKLNELSKETTSPSTQQILEDLDRENSKLKKEQDALAALQQETPESYTRKAYISWGQPDEELSPGDIKIYGEKLENSVQRLRDSIEQIERTINMLQAELDDTNRHHLESKNSNRLDTEQKLAAINDIESRYMDEIRKLKEQDVASISHIYRKNYTPSEVMKFLVTDSSVKLDGYNLFLNNEPIETTYTDAQRLGFEMARPDTLDFQAQWEQRWLGAINRSVDRLALGQFPFYCDDWRGHCSERSR